VTPELNHEGLGTGLEREVEEELSEISRKGCSPPDKVEEVEEDEEEELSKLRSRCSPPDNVEEEDKLTGIPRDNCSPLDDET